MEPWSWKQGASRAREAQGEIEDQEKDDREVKAQAEDNCEDDEEEVDTGSLTSDRLGCEHSRRNG